MAWQVWRGALTGPIAVDSPMPGGSVALTACAEPAIDDAPSNRPATERLTSPLGWEGRRRVDDPFSAIDTVARS
jgi:hypothetical protein